MTLSLLVLQAQSAAPSIAVSLAPVVMGGVLAYFKMFIGSQEEFRKRMSFLRSTHIEKTAAQHARLLKHANSVVDGVLRGDGREEPDFVGEYEEDAFRRVRVFHRLERIRFTVKLGFDVLFRRWCMAQLSEASRRPGTANPRVVLCPVARLSA